MARELALVMISSRFSSALAYASGVIEDSTRGVVLVPAQDAQAGAEHGPQQVLAVRRPCIELVLAVAEEREVVVGEPAQQLDRVGDVLVRHRRAARARCASSSARPSACGRILGQSSTASRTSVSTRRRSLCELLAVVAVADRVDLDAHPALDDVAGDRVVGLDVGADLDELAHRLAAHHDQRVHQQVDVEVAGGQRAVTESTRNGMSSVTISITRVRLVGDRAR